MKQLGRLKINHLIQDELKDHEIKKVVRWRNLIALAIALLPIIRWQITVVVITMVMLTSIGMSLVTLQIRST